MLRRSRVDRARRSSRVTMSTSPASSWSRTRRSWTRSVFAPLAVSRHRQLRRGHPRRVRRRAVDRFRPLIRILAPWF
jgi:hypothetical protein